MMREVQKIAEGTQRPQEQGEKAMRYRGWWWGSLVGLLLLAAAVGGCNGDDHDDNHHDGPGCFFLSEVEPRCR